MRFLGFLLRADKIIVDVITRNRQPIIERGSTVPMRYQRQVEFEFDQREVARADAVDPKRFLDGDFAEAP